MHDILYFEIKSHRAFNECCLSNNLLPNYTNICICIHVRICICICIYMHAYMHVVFSQTKACRKFENFVLVFEDLEKNKIC